MNTKPEPTIPCEKCGGALLKGGAARYTDPLQNQYVCKKCEHETWLSDERVAEKCRHHKKLANLVIYKSDDGKKWAVVKPEDVPDWIKNPDVMHHLVNGETAQAPGELTCYAALQADSPTNLAPH